LIEKKSAERSLLIKGSGNPTYNAISQNTDVGHPLFVDCEGETTSITSFSLDYNSIFKQRHPRLLNLIPKDYQQHKEEILQLRGTPINNYYGLLLASISGYLLMGMSGAMASKLTSISPFYRFVLASSSLLFGGFLRPWGAKEADAGRGKLSIAKLLSVGIIGSLGLLLIIRDEESLANVQINSFTYALLMIFNTLTGFGVACYSPCMVMCAKLAPGTSYLEFLNTRDSLAEDMELESVATSFFESIMAPLIGKDDVGYMAIIGGLGNIIPALTLIILSCILPKFGLKGGYILFGGLAIAGFIAINSLLEEAPYDQLVKMGVNGSSAENIAKFLGQTNISNTSDTYLNKIKKMSNQDRLSLLIVCANYMTTLGTLFAITSSGSLTLIRRKISVEEATSLIGYLIGLDSIVRTLMPMIPMPLSPDTISSLSFAGMAVSSCISAICSEQNLWLSSLFMFAIANGVGNYSVVAQIRHSLPNNIGIATGLSSGVGAFSAFFISLLCAHIAGFNKATGQSPDGNITTDTAYEYLVITSLSVFSLLTNYMYSCYKDNAVPTSTSNDVEGISLNLPPIYNN
jgi:nitrate/nitrite transporter NarK